MYDTGLAASFAGGSEGNGQNTTQHSSARLSKARTYRQLGNVRRTNDDRFAHMCVRRESLVVMCFSDFGLAKFWGTSCLQMADTKLVPKVTYGSRQGEEIQDTKHTIPSRTPDDVCAYLARILDVKRGVNEGASPKCL